MRQHVRSDGLALLAPAYNAARFLPRLLESAHAQAIPFDEIWVYDDGSTDETAQVARDMGARVVRGESNRGPSYGRNTLAESTGAKWLHFHDADDALLPGFTTLARRHMALDEHDVVLFDYETRDHATGRHREIRHFDKAALLQDPIRFAIVEQICAIHGLYRRDAFLSIGGFASEMRYDEDPHLHLRLALAQCRFTADSDVQIINYLRPDSVSATRRHDCVAARYDTMCLAAKAVGERYGPEIAGKLWQAASGAALFLDWPLADKAAAKALELAEADAAGLSPLFAFLVRMDPRFALRIRELLVRGFKPAVRPPGHRGVLQALNSIVSAPAAVAR